VPATVLPMLAGRALNFFEAVPANVGTVVWLQRLP
jgi:hypothetical protein